MGSLGGGGQGAFQVEGRAIPSPELCLEALPSQPGGQSLAPEFGIRTQGSRMQGVDLSLAEVRGCWKTAVGSSLEALSGPCPGTFQAAEDTTSCWGYCGGHLSQILSNLKILF